MVIINKIYKLIILMKNTIESGNHNNATASNDWTEEMIFSIASKNSLSDILKFIELIKNSKKLSEQQKNKIINIYKKIMEVRKQIDESMNKDIKRQKETEKFKQGQLIKKLQESLVAPDVEYRYYWWSWSFSNDMLNHIGELEILRSWTNVDWINSCSRRQELISQWMDVWFVWNNPNYVISNIDWDDKYSKWYNNCTWIVLFWKDDNWRSISMLSHQNPWYFLSDKKFENDMVEKIRSFVKNCKSWSIDAFIVWWNIWTSQKNQIYKKSVWYLSKIIQMELEKEPRILSPNNNIWTVTIKVETQQNKIIILQPKQK